MVKTTNSSSGSNKRKGRGGGGGDDANATASIEPKYKQTCVTIKSQDPDVTIVVGGYEFKEYSQVLALVSGFFDTALNSGMRESQTKVFHFPDKDPNEWELFMSVVSPGSTETITEDNLPTILQWCDELSVSCLMPRCDEVWCNGITRTYEEIVSLVNSLSSARDETLINTVRAQVPLKLDQFLDLMDTSLARNLTKSNELGFRKLCFFLQRTKYSKYITLGHLKRILAIVKEYYKDDDDNDEEEEGGCAILWQAILTHIPSELHSDSEEEDPEPLISNELLPHLILKNLDFLAIPSKLEHALERELSNNKSARQRILSKFRQNLLSPAAD